MTCRCCPALLNLRAEVDATYPDRDQASDGCCASSSHSQQNPKSDHEPRRSGPAKGRAIALDIDEDLTPKGPGPDDLTGLLFHLYGATEADADPRVKYLIYERRIYYPHDGKRARGNYPYTGTNPHDKHLHTSIDEWAWNDPRPWLPTQKDDFMAALTDKQQEELYLWTRDLHTSLDDVHRPGFASVIRLLKLIGSRLGVMAVDLEKAEKGK